ncbi:MAG: dihydrodipicolinate reductase [Clostridiales bacterium]|jgi:2,4-diaminopentanoate dehydrogenase|nr:dihydrodipicolinate reductase [Clostridiales bacterium]
MWNQIKVLQVGCGKMAKYTMRYVFEKGGSVVAGIDANPELIGKDIGYVIDGGIKGPIIYGVTELERVIKASKPDIAVIETKSLLKEVSEIIKVLVSNGINVITTCEEAFYAENSNPNLFKEIDKLAKSNNCTVTGSGYQDVFWGNLISTLAGSIHKITKIVGSSMYNVEDYGIALARAHGAGLTEEEFNNTIAIVDNITEEERQRLISNGEFLPSYMWNTIGWLVDKLGLTITNIIQKCIPKVDLIDLNSQTLNMTIPKGSVTGMSAVVTANTKEGIIIEAECIGKVYNENEFDKNEWTILGEPNTTITVNKPHTVELTCANIVNRIPDVINAEPGFISTSKMNGPKYLVSSLDKYVDPKKLNKF